MIRRFHEAKIQNSPTVTCWGTGSPRREFLYVDEMADACVFLMKNYNSNEIINIGFGEDFTIKEISETISDIVGYQGKIIWDTSKPDGTPNRLLSCNKLFNMGWKPKTTLKDGLERSYNWFTSQNP